MILVFHFSVNKGKNYATKFLYHSKHGKVLQHPDNMVSLILSLRVFSRKLRTVGWKILLRQKQLWVLQCGFEYAFHCYPARMRNRFCCHCRHCPHKNRQSQNLGVLVCTTVSMIIQYTQGMCSRRSPIASISVIVIVHACMCSIIM